MDKTLMRNTVLSLIFFAASLPFMAHAQILAPILHSKANTPPATISFVQGSQLGENISTNSLTVTSPTIQSGDCVVLEADTNLIDTLTLSSASGVITSWTSAGSQVQENANSVPLTEAVWVGVAGSTGTFTVTANTTGTGPLSVSQSEFSDCKNSSPLDSSVYTTYGAAVPSTGTVPSFTSSGATAHVNEMIVVTWRVGGDSQMAAATGWSQSWIGQFVPYGYFMGGFYQSVATSGSSVSFVGTGSGWNTNNTPTSQTAIMVGLVPA